MSELWSAMERHLTSPQVVIGVRVVLILLAGFPLARLGGHLVAAKRLHRLHPQHRLVIQRVIRYAVLGLAVTWALNEMGVSLSVLVGAAGLLTVALGFASQTSASNVISGLFLMGEQPFVVGDYIRVGESSGEVVSIDLLSVKLRTYDNLLLRIPNETMLKANVTNVTHFPIRRLDMKIGVAYKEQVDHVRQVLLEVARRNPICLEEPEPLIIFLGFGDSALEFQFSVWCATDNFILLRNTMHEEVKGAFDEHGIEIPFPHRTLYAGSATDPFPVRVVEALPASRTVPPHLPQNRGRF